MVAPLWFAAVYLILSGLRPEYSHTTKAISELGSVGAPRAWAWNLLGYVAPGVVVALLGVGIGRRLAGRAARVASWALVASGLFLVLSGIFPGDFENRRATTMIIHAVGSLGCFAAFLVAAAALPVAMRRVAGWRPFVWPSIALAAGSILTGFLRSGSAPGVGQRLGFAFFFLWIGMIGWALHRDPGLAAPAWVPQPGSPSTRRR